jgi:hypothetical protein
MSTPEHEWFRQALRSAADSIEPRSGGLEIIQARLHRRPYPLPVAWLAATWMRLTMRVTEGASSAGRQVSDKLRLASAGAHSAGRQVARKLRWAYTEEIPADGKVGEKLRTISQWFVSELPEPVADARAGKSSAWSLLRPLAAFGVAVFIVAVGAYAAIRIPAIGSTPSGNSQQQGPGNGVSPNGRNGLNGGSSSPFPSPGSIGWPTPSSSSSTPYPCITKPGPRGGSPSATPTTSQGQSGSASPTSPVPTSPNSSTPPPTGTPTPTPTYSQSPAAGGQSPAAGGQSTPGASAGVARTTTDEVILPAKAAAPSVHTSKSPCSTPSPRKTTKRPANRQPNASRTPALGGLFPAKPARHQSNNSA